MHWTTAVLAAVSLSITGCAATAGDDTPARAGAPASSTTSRATASSAGPTTTTVSGTAPATTAAPASPDEREPAVSEQPALDPDGLPLPVSAPATALVDRLVVAVEDPDGAPYRRKEFGSGWKYDSRSGCNTRELVLIGESRRAPVVDDRCKPLSGDWVSLYDGVETADPSALEIDHLVPLADAWRSGASTWTAARRKAFANDLTDPDTLVAVTSHSNRSKSDSSPDEWLPSNEEDRCRYVEAWIRVKYRWSLRATPAEKSTLVQVLGGC